MLATKKILVILFIIVLGSSVFVGASSLFRNSQQQAVNVNNNITLLNARLNNVVDFCINSLPKGMPACDNQLRFIVNQVCEKTNGQQILDACHNGKVDQYYKVRGEQTNKTIIKNNNITNNTTSSLRNNVKK